MGPLLILIRHLLRTPYVIIQTLHICDLHTIGRTRILDTDPQPLTLILRLREVAVGNVARLSPNDRVEPFQPSLVHPHLRMVEDVVHPRGPMSSMLSMFSSDVARKWL